MKYKILPPRESDQLFFVANNKKISKLTGLKPKISKEKGLKNVRMAKNELVSI